MDGQLDCFFFIDMESDIPYEQKCIECLCIECREESYPEVGWFYEGSVEGYAEGAEWRCKVCDKLISANNESTDDTENETASDR